MSDNLVIVAIPAENDYVWKISSEKKPHMTLLFLGELSAVSNVAQIADFVSHAATTSLKRFGMEVERRATLGEDEADVLFFDKKFAKDITNFRAQLLKDDNIFKAYNSTEQFPEWQPHLTLGYPKTPAKKDDREYPGINWVHFDKIGFWYGDFEGLEFPIPDYDWDMEVSMSTISDGQAAVQEALAHFGVKGMKWGQRKQRVAVTSTSKTGATGKTLVKTKGGTAQPAHSDAVAARVIGQQLKKSGKNSLSNAELQRFNNRLNLEQNAQRLAIQERSPVRRWIAGILKQQGTQAANSVAQDQVKKTLARKAIKTAAVAAV